MYVVHTMYIILSALLYKYAPLICSKLSIHTNCPWFNSDLCSLKIHTRKLDIFYRKTPTHQNHSNFILARNSYCHNMFHTKSEFYHSKITAAVSNIKTLYKITDSLLGRFKQTQLPDMPDELLCNTFADLFTEKIETIHNKLTKTASTSNYNWLPNYLSAYMQNFIITSSIDIQHIILTSKSSSQTDVLPLVVTKILSDQPFIIFKDVINLSISTGDNSPPT